MNKTLDLGCDNDQRKTTGGDTLFKVFTEAKPVKACLCHGSSFCNQSRNWRGWHFLLEHRSVEEDCSLTTFIE